jgi:phage terminase large subunit
MDLSFLNPTQRVLAEEVIRKCAMSRLYFVKEILDVKHVEEWQMEVLSALDAGETKLSIRSGHGVGKTALCSWCALHFLLFRDDVKVVVTSPSFKQMSDGLISEVQKWINRLPAWMATQLDTTSDRVTRKPNNRNNFMSFRTARKENPEALAGVHASHVMIIVDEASGVDEVVYETGQGALSTVGAIALLIGNPTQPSGFFYKTQTSLADLWWCRKVSCMDSTRVSPDYIEAQKRTYGENSREFAVRVLGEFPKAGADSIIPRSFVQAAVGRDVVPIVDVRYWGVDPGRGGDPTGFIERTPNAILDAAEFRYDDLMQVTGRIYKKWQECPPSKRPANVFVDSNGLGAGVADRLLELGLPVVHVNVSEAASVSDAYLRLRDELWFEARNWFEGADKYIDPNLPFLGEFIEELSSVNYKILSSGKVQVEPKDTIRKRLARSSNLADAFNMTFAKQGAVLAGTFRGRAWSKVDTANYRAPGFRKKAS